MIGPIKTVGIYIVFGTGAFFRLGLNPHFVGFIVLGAFAAVAAFQRGSSKL